jgi:hypothetical protein
MTGKAGMVSALLKMRANSNIVLCILLPDCNSGVTFEGGLARRATMSLLACLRWSSRVVFGKGMVCGKYLTVATVLVVRVAGK